MSPIPDLKGHADMEAVQKDRVHTVSLEAAVPFQQRLEALDAFSLFMNSAEPIMKAGVASLDEIDWDKCDENWTDISQDIELVGTKFDAHGGDHSDIKTKLSMFGQKVKAELKLKRIDEAFVNTMLNILHNPVMKDEWDNLMSKWRKKKVQLFSEVRNALSIICQRYQYGALILANHPILYDQALVKAQDVYDIAVETLKMATAKKAKLDENKKSEIDKIKKGAAVKMETIDTEINQIEGQVKGDLRELQKDFQSASHEMDAFTVDIDNHLKMMRKKVNAGIGFSQTARNKQNTDASPAGQHLKNSKKAVDDWEDGELARAFRIAKISATQAAEDAKKAADIYERIEGNQLNVLTITGYTHWGNDDVSFAVDIAFDFILTVPVLKWDIHIGPIDLATLHISLHQIEEVCTHIFKYLWDALWGEI